MEKSKAPKIVGGQWPGTVRMTYNVPPIIRELMKEKARELRIPQRVLFEVLIHKYCRPNSEEITYDDITNATIRF